MNFENEVTAKVMGEILAKGMSLSGVDLSKTVESEALSALGKIKHVLDEEKNQAQKLEMVQKIVEAYNI